MVQIIDENKKPSFMQRLGKGLAGAGESAGRSYAERLMQQEQLGKQQQQLSQENAAALKMGIDLSGINDPKMRQLAVQMHMQGGNQRDIEKLRQEGKRGLLQEKQGFLNQILGQGSQQQPQEMGTESQFPQGFNPAQVSDADIARASAIDPVLGRELRAAKDTALRERRFEREFEEKQKLRSPEHQREQRVTAAQAASDVKYNQELQSAHKQHEIKTQTLDRLEQLNKKGVTGKPYEKLLEKAGLVNLTSEGRREFAADVKNLITDIRSILGGQFSTFEFQTILNAYPSADFSKTANDAIIKNLKDFQDIRNQEFKIAKDIKKENKGKIPEDFQSMVNERLEQYAQSRLPEIKANAQKIMNEEYGIPEGNVLMFDPQGEPLNVSPQEVERYQSLGATLP